MQESTDHMRQPWSQLLTGSGLLLILLLALSQFSSNGVARSGGDDAGSGIGGTGRTLNPSGDSGIGGTGFKPFLGMNANQEIEIIRDPSPRNSEILFDIAKFSIPPTPISPPATRVAHVMREQDLTIDSSTIDISEVVQITLDIDALTLTQLRNELLQFAGNAQAVSESDESGHSITWEDVAMLLERTSDQPELHTALSEAANLADLQFASEQPPRITRPEKIQRPELPPIQRISPLQRTAILPPRVQPLRL